MNPDGTTTVFQSLLGQLILLVIIGLCYFSFRWSQRFSRSRFLRNSPRRQTARTTRPFQSSGYLLASLLLGAAIGYGLLAVFAGALLSARPARRHSPLRAAAARGAARRQLDLPLVRTGDRGDGGVFPQAPAHVARRSAAQSHRQPRETTLAAGGIPGHQMARGDCLGHGAFVDSVARAAGTRSAVVLGVTSRWSTPC